MAPDRPEGGTEGIIYIPFMGIWGKLEIPSNRGARYNRPITDERWRAVVRYLRTVRPLPEEVPAPRGVRTLKRRLSRLLTRLRRALISLIAPRKARPAYMPLQHASRVGGKTVYNEAPLRFRNLSVAEPELPTFGDLPGSQEGFKIRVTRQPSRHREAGRMVEQR